MNILVTGGCGYIGATVVDLLKRKKHSVVVIDDLSTGKESKIGDSPLIKLDIASEGAKSILEDALREHQIDAVIHFAAKKQVGESVKSPELYYRDNIGGLNNLLWAMRDAGVGKLIFSSSAAVYGMPDLGDDEALIEEGIAKSPINPYGETKLISEWMCADARRAWGLDYAALRYFNVAGAASDALGDSVALNLVPMVFERIVQGFLPRVFGVDYPTADGTCVRDYVHVEDLAEAHIMAIDYLGGVDGAEQKFFEFNVGTGVGSSVFEVIDEIRDASGLEFENQIEGRRPGDPAKLVGDCARIQAEMGFEAKHDLKDIVQSAWSAFQSREE